MDIDHRDIETQVNGVPIPHPGPTHTPGPWTFVAGKGAEFSNKPRGRIAICEVPPKEGGVQVLALTFDDSFEACENARLMAAAPDLLAALKLVSREVGDLGHYDGVSEAVDAAIAKAEGEA